MRNSRLLLPAIAAAAAVLAVGTAFLLRRPAPAFTELSEDAAPAPEVYADEIQAKIVQHGEDSFVIPDAADLPNTSYTLKLRDDTLSIYEEGVREPIAEYELPAGWLPEYDRILLEYGIRVGSADELRQLIEDYVS